MNGFAGTALAFIIVCADNCDIVDGYVSVITRWLFTLFLCKRQSVRYVLLALLPICISFLAVASLLVQLRAKLSSAAIMFVDVLFIALTFLLTLAVISAVKFILSLSQSDAT